MSGWSAPATGGPALVLALVLSAAVAAAGCTPAEPTPATGGQATGRPSPTVSAAMDLTRVELARVLGERNLILSDPTNPFRPAEAATLTDVPRAIFQVTLPDDPMGGYIAVYEFLDPAHAAAAGREQATYLGSGPGRVQTALDSHHVIRQVGSTIVLYTWSPGGALDPRTPDIEAALDTLGVAIPVPR